MDSMGFNVDGAHQQQHVPLEAQLQATLNMIPAHAWYALPNGQLTFLNERAADYLGLPEDHPLRLGTGDSVDWESHILFLHPDDREGTRGARSDRLSTGSAGEVSFRVRNAEGAYRWFVSRTEPVRAPDGTLLYWIGLNLDIEERKQAEFYLAEGQRLAHIGSWAFTPAGFEYWSPELFQIHGLDPRATRQQRKSIWPWCIRKIGNLSSNRFKRCWGLIGHSTSRSESSGLTASFEASVAWGCLQFRMGIS